MTTSPTPAAPDRPTVAKRRVPLGSIVLIIAGALLALIALGPLVGGGVLLWARTTQRDADGFYTTPTERFETTSAAITSERIDLGSGPANQSGYTSLGDTTVRLRVQSTGERAAFVGIARQDDVDRYLAGIAHAELQQVRVAPFAPDYRYVDGTGTASAPGTQSIWVASAQGRGQQSIEWKLDTGRWAVVVMNADASPGVSVNATAAAQAPWVLPVAIGLLLGGGVAAAVGLVLLVVGVVALARGTEIDLTVQDDSGARPVALEGRLDEPLNRWLWLVKWVLLIPHVIVLAVLWMAFSVVTFIAFFAILFTGRYPRALFEFNAGVLRWTWRVNYYGYNALGTDQYPPFSLGQHPDYPATFEIAYPAQLSRGLVLIKWWLLAIPQYFVLALIGGGTFLAFRTGWATASVPFGGLIGLLVFLAAVALLFTGQYPRGIHDLVMGLNRWVFRVLTYVALMRDEYPPFRLDQGPTEPAPPAPPSPEEPGDRTARTDVLSGTVP